MPRLLPSLLWISLCNVCSVGFTQDPPRSIAEMSTKTILELQREQLRLEDAISQRKLQQRPDAWQHLLKSKLIGDIARMQYLERALKDPLPGSDQAARLPNDPLKITLAQRTSKPIPGFEGIVRLAIRDITHQQVLLEVTSELLTLPIIDTVSVEEGDVLPFNVGGVVYYLSVIELRNHLIGDDFAVFEVSTKQVDEKAKISKLLKTVKRSELTFIRNGKQHTSEATAEHLRQKWRQATPPIRTVTGFINRIASRSSITDEPYLVEQADGTSMEAQLWLRRQIAEEEDRKAAKSSKIRSRQPGS